MQILNSIHSNTYSSYLDNAVENLEHFFKKGFEDTRATSDSLSLELQDFLNHVQDRSHEEVESFKGQFKEKHAALLNHVQTLNDKLKDKSSEMNQNLRDHLSSTLDSVSKKASELEEKLNQLD